ncbi:MAG: peptidoglycan bridge formation glycyltransferase FemA/FemB family protein [Lentisphaerae bacterium]|nr:peptidoglycan bridge formation glycyltransferase FemA/FemB family protein [Lentisphaerota bacterium]
MISETKAIVNRPSSTQIQVDGQTSESWGAILSQFADASIYQTWAYGAIRWGHRNLSHVVMIRNGQVLAAAQLRIARIPLLPAGIAYLRWGPLCQRNGQPLDPEIVSAMVVSLRDEYCKRRGLTLQVVPNAFSGSVRGGVFDVALTRSGLKPESTGPDYRTIVVNLQPSAEVMRKHLDQKWRNQLNRAEKNGLVLESRTDLDAYREFVALYEVMWTRKQFETSVNVEEFGRILEQLPEEQKMLTLLARKDGEAVAALVVSRLGEEGIYVLGATNDKARDLKAAYFLQWQAMLWLKEHGARSYDLGGIDPDGNPGGYHFKSGLGGVDLSHLHLHVKHGSFLSLCAAKIAAWRRRDASHKPAKPNG